MKKLILLLSITIFLTGCTIVRIDTSNIDNILSVVLSKDNNLYNQVGKGYKYYIPRAVSYVDTNGLNEKLYSSGNYYYLYIDALNYYYQKEVVYTAKDDVYYSKAIDNNDKQGYLEITKQDDLYFIEFMYNYAKIETLVKKSDINTTVLNASYILSTVKFNNSVIELMFNDDYFTGREKQYDIFSTNNKNTTLSKKWLEVYEEDSGN